MENLAKAAEETRLELSATLNPEQLKQRLISGIEKNFEGQIAIQLKLKQTLDTVVAQLGETVLPAEQLIPALKVGVDAFNTKRFAAAVEKCESRPLQSAEYDEVAAALPLAVAAYTEAQELKTELKKHGLQLLYQDTTTEPGKSVSHYVAFSVEQKRVVVGIKGTSCMDDVITDAVCTPVPLRRNYGQFERQSDALAHEAMSGCAHSIKDRLGYVLKDLFAANSFDVLVTGHSLGAGTATLLAILLHDELGLKRVRGVGIATPPVADKATALSSKSYITSVAHETDVVTVASVANLIRMNGTLKRIAAATETLVPEDAPREWESAVSEAQASYKGRKEDMYVPGKVVFLYQNGEQGDALKYKAVVHDGTFPMLQSIHTSPTMIEDHLSGPYASAIASVKSTLT